MVDYCHHTQRPSPSCTVHCMADLAFTNTDKECLCAECRKLLDGGMDLLLPKFGTVNMVPRAGSELPLPY